QRQSTGTARSEFEHQRLRAGQIRHEPLHLVPRATAGCTPGPHSSSGKDCIQGRGRPQPPAPFVYKSFPKRKLGGPVGGPEKAETSEVITIIIIGFGERIGDAEVAAAAR